MIQLKVESFVEYSKKTNRKDLSKSFWYFVVFTILRVLLLRYGMKLRNVNKNCIG